MSLVAAPKMSPNESKHWVMKLISATKLTNLVSLEQFHHKPMAMYGGGLPELALGQVLITIKTISGRE